MSDLAPFVAALLESKVIVEMKEEIDSLREQVRQSRTVAITGPRGTPVYCQGQFDEGRYADNPNLWAVEFGAPLQTCPLSEVKDVEIRVGGVCKANFALNNDDIEASLYGGDGDFENDRGQVSFCFGDTGGLWLDVSIGPFQSEELYRQLSLDTDAGVDPEELVNHIIRGPLVEENPDMTIVFSDIHFYVRHVDDAIKSLSLDRAIEAEAQRRREEQDEEIAQMIQWRFEGIGQNDGVEE